MAATSRTIEDLQREIEAERLGLASSVEQLRSGIGEATDVVGKLRAHLGVAVAGALGTGFVLAGGVGATMRYLARRGRERR